MSELKDQFTFAHRLYDGWMLVEKDRYIIESKLDPLVIRLSMTLNVQACRQFRSIIELCERGEATNAMIVGRSLYETAVALMFVLSPQVPIRVKQKSGKTDAWQAEIHDPQLASNSFTNRLRAALYLSSTVFNDERCYLKWNKRAELQQMANVVKPGQALVDFCEREIGKEWSFILRHRPHTFSGLSLAELTKALGNNLDLYYDTVYHLFSRMAHAADAIRHASDNNGCFGPQWWSSVDDICGGLQAGSQVFLASTKILQNNFGFGTDTDSKLDELIANFHKVFA